MPNETNDTSFTGFFDGPRVPSLSSYCSSPTCGTGYPCDLCRVEDGSLSCDLCDAPAEHIDRHGGQILPLCGPCKRTCDAEDEAARWGSWRPASAWFAGKRFINVVTDVYKIRFSAEKGGAP